MPERFITNAAELDAWCTFIKGRKLPMKVTCSDATKRSIAQNKLQRRWCAEVSEQLGDMTPEEVRGHAKAYFGVPILLHEDEEFAAAYETHIKPLPYETKLACMMEPIDFPVTRRMTTKQLTRYLDDFCAYWRGKGIHLTTEESE